MEAGRVGRAVLVLVALLPAACTAGGVGPVPADSAGRDDVAQLRVEGPPPSPAARPGDVLAWRTAPLTADPVAVRDGLVERYGLGFVAEPAGAYPGTRWVATTGSAVEADDVVRSMTVLQDEDGRLRALHCLVAGRLDPAEHLLEVCVDLVGLSPEASPWTARQARRTGEGAGVAERVLGGALVRVSTHGDWDRRVQSVSVRSAATGG